MSSGYNVVKFPLEDFNKSEISDSIDNNKQDNELIDLNNVDEIAKENTKTNQPSQPANPEQSFHPINPSQIDKIAKENYEKGFSDAKIQSEIECNAKLEQYESISARINDALEAFQDEKTTFFDNLSRVALEIINLSVTKLSTQIGQNNLNNLNKFIEEVISAVKSEASIQISFNPQFYKDNEKHINQLLNRSINSDLFEIKNSTDVPHNDCKITWSEGSAEFNSKKVFDEISAKLTYFNDNNSI